MKSQITLLILFCTVLVLAICMPLLLFLSMPSRSTTTTLPDERRVSLRDGDIRYQIAGEGKATVVLLHGFNQTLESWDPVWSRLAQCPIRRIRIDIPGFGDSFLTTTDYSLAAQSDRLAELLDRLDTGPVAVVGVSMGASMAAWFAARHPQRVTQLGLFSPSGATDSLTHGGLYGRLLKPGPLQDVATWIARASAYQRIFPRSMALQALTTVSSYGTAWDAQLEKVQAPALIAWSRNDSVARADSATAIKNKLHTATLIWLDDQAGHDIPTTRAQLTAEAACLLAQGVAPATIPTRLSPEATPGVTVQP